MRKLLCLLLTLFILSAPRLSAQESDLGNWIIYLGNKSLGDRWNLHHEVQYRNYNFVGDLEQLLLRTGVGYDVTDNFNVLLGYGYINSQNYVDPADDKVVIDEHRIYQQLVTRQQLGRVGLQHRYRFEERFVENKDFGFRFRYFLSMNVPLTGPDMAPKTLYLSAYNEIFVTTEDNPFDRNRLYGGLGYVARPGLRFELGYMNQFFATGGRDQINLITSASF
ncbi:hypothetical protein GGR26_000576 [Lewinella marina]|uniref:DUF2490 domain-containing protein n=1 Tax=Neolewinella marina TaxID=438751 RepID=A0A2G0CJ62_9BACT|nr:DUF2490 domain-containing protein [Neolewinella marina]NJB84831.1 hypothetical protein [Neolewinella marina]PHL00013.1 hypothetical protein CGL56_02920 [Neolewinella marina]